jgi:hypothetical protein
MAVAAGSVDRDPDDRETPQEGGHALEDGGVGRERLQAGGGGRDHPSLRDGKNGNLDDALSRAG